jgi:hypothetical protein
VGSRRHVNAIWLAGSRARVRRPCFILYVVERVAAGLQRPFGVLCKLLAPLFCSELADNLRFLPVKKELTIPVQLNPTFFFPRDDLYGALGGMTYVIWGTTTRIHPWGYGSTLVAHRQRGWPGGFFVLVNLFIMSKLSGYGSFSFLLLPGFRPVAGRRLSPQDQRR